MGRGRCFGTKAGRPNAQVQAPFKRLCTALAMQQLLFVTVRQDCDTGTIFGNLKLRGQGELQHGVIEVDQGVDPDKALQRFAASLLKAHALIGAAVFSVNRRDKMTGCLQASSFQVRRISSYLFLSSEASSHPDRIGVRYYSRFMASGLRSSNL